MAGNIDIRARVLDLVGAAPLGVRQTTMGLAYMAKPRRLPGLLPMLRMTVSQYPSAGKALIPDPGSALANPDGLCGLAGRLDVPALLEGYRRGMFVMSHIGPLKWWAPRYRMVLFFDRARVEKTVRRLLRGRKFEITFDRAFDEVVASCAEPRPGHTPLTWITPQIKKLFGEAHALGHAHSVEVWQEGRLAGGAFGLHVGNVFFTESQFHVVRDASKVGFAVLNRHLQKWGFALNDGKHPTRYLADCGMIPVTRDEFRALAEGHGGAERAAGPWQVEEALLDDQWQPAETPGLTAEEVLPGGSVCTLTVDELLTTERSPTW